MFRDDFKRVQCFIELEIHTDDEEANWTNSLLINRVVQDDASRDHLRPQKEERKSSATSGAFSLRRWSQYDEYRLTFLSASNGSRKFLSHTKWKIFRQFLIRSNLKRSCSHHENLNSCTFKTIQNNEEGHSRQIELPEVY
jgi:hypothetical protein